MYCFSSWIRSRPLTLAFGRHQRTSPDRASAAGCRGREGHPGPAGPLPQVDEMIHFDTFCPDFAAHLLPGVFIQVMFYIHFIGDGRSF